MKKFLTLLFLTVPFCLFLFAQTKPKPRAKTKPATAGASSAANGSKIYKQYCLTCHMADGGGVPNMNATLIKTSYISGDKTRLIKVLLNGLQGVEIDGESYQNNMPTHSFLKDQEIADVLTYVRSNFGNKAGAVKVAEVKAVRAANTGK
jgi:mono/diheme cytochrome c family protein